MADVDEGVGTEAGVVARLAIAAAKPMVYDLGAGETQYLVANGEVIAEESNRPTAFGAEYDVLEDFFDALGESDKVVMVDGLRASTVLARDDWGYASDVASVKERAPGWSRALPVIMNVWWKRDEFAEQMWALQPYLQDSLTILSALEIITGTIQANFVAGESLRDGGRKLQYEETVEAKGGASGQVDIPDTVTFEFPFVGHTIELLGRLRFRVREGEVSFRLDNPEADNYLKDEMRDAFYKAVKAGMPKVKVYRGRLW